jgi:hypothetical protein
MLCDAGESLKVGKRMELTIMCPVSKVLIF